MIRKNFNGVTIYERRNYECAQKSNVLGNQWRLCEAINAFRLTAVSPGFRRGRASHNKKSKAYQYADLFEPKLQRIQYFSSLLAFQ